MATAYDLGRKGNVSDAIQALERIQGPGRSAALGLKESLERYGESLYSYTARLEDALTAISEGDNPERHYRDLLALGHDVGYAPSLHFLGWLHRYMAESHLRRAAECFAEAADGGHRAASLHAARVREMLVIAEAGPS